MYAIIKTGGKQYKVSEGDTIFVEKLGVAADETVSFNEVVAVGEGSDLKVGAPFVEGASVSAKVLKEGKALEVMGSEEFKEVFGYLGSITGKPESREQGGEVE